MLDFASILRSSQGLVPDLRQQSMQDEQFRAQREAIAEQRAAKEAARQRQGQFQAEMEQTLLSRDPDAIIRMMARYPEFSEQVKPLWEQMDERQRTTDLTQSGSIFMRAQAGDFKGAAAILEQRITADGPNADQRDRDILAGLKSDSPVERNAAMQMIGVHLFAVAPEAAAKMFSALNPSENKTGVQREYDWRTAQFGKKAADEWLATQDVELVVGEPGAPIFDKRDFIRGTGQPANPVAQRGGDQSTGGRVAPPTDGPLGPWIEQAAGLTASSRKRATGVPGTYHADDNARDFPTPSLSANVAEGRRLKALFGPAFDVVYSETDKSGKHDNHVHVEPGPALGAKVRGSGPVKVKTKQQYDKLASGTRYTAPDGSQRVKP